MVNRLSSTLLASPTNRKQYFSGFGGSNSKPKKVPEHFYALGDSISLSLVQNTPLDPNGSKAPGCRSACCKTGPRHKGDWDQPFTGWHLLLFERALCGVVFWHAQNKRDLTRPTPSFCTKQWLVKAEPPNPFPLHLNVATKRPLKIISAREDASLRLRPALTPKRRRSRCRGNSLHPA